MIHYLQVASDQIIYDENLVKKAAKIRRSTCPIDYAIEIFGDRWTLLVLRDLLFLGKRHFRELCESEEGIATNILASRLKKLESRGLISRSVDPKDRRQVVYVLTEKGLALAPAMLEIIRWSAKYDPDSGAPASLVNRIKKNRDQVAGEIIARARRVRETAR